MATIKRSALFKRQLIQIIGGYREKAGSEIALKFVDSVENSIAFIAGNPAACAVYTQLDGHEFRKWRVNSFPASIFFRIDGADIIVLEALYAHRMNIAARFSSDIE